MKLLPHYLNVKNSAKPEIINWRDNHINDSLFYSYRSTDYNRQTYPARMHYHDYYELVIFVEGDIHYICESEIYPVHYGDIILIPPRKLHMSMINGEATCYKRHVFYLYPDAFDSFGCNALTSFLNENQEKYLLTAFDKKDRNELISLLNRLDESLKNRESQLDQSLALAYIIQIFYLFNKEKFRLHKGKQHLPKNVSEIKLYLDQHFQEIDSVAEVAAHFFYSREYVSRLFKQYFNTTVADYIKIRRIAYSQTLIAQGIPLSEVCFQAGFGNLTTFIRAFNSIVGMAPSKYRKILLENQEI
ncbi:MAG: helix-turn-helix domain-containing protein [Tyzzerella sp.]|nr:helix-turn-helix domain-containing protein [Tyzzerella sp.]